MPNVENHHDLTFKGVFHGYWLFEIKTFPKPQLIDAHSSNINIYTPFYEMTFTTVGHIHHRVGMHTDNGRY